MTVQKAPSFRLGLSTTVPRPCLRKVRCELSCGRDFDLRTHKELVSLSAIENPEEGLKAFRLFENVLSSDENLRILVFQILIVYGSRVQGP
jgi:hypothetical protein